MSAFEPAGRSTTVDKPVAGTLKPDAIGLTGVLFQGIATMAPAFGLAISFQFTVTQAGQAAPLVFLFAAVVVLLMAINVGQLAKKFPSAGGFYTYIARTVHPRAGFLSGWIFSFWLPPSAALALSFIAKVIISPELKAQYGVTIPWYVIAIASCALVFLLAYRGISISERAMIAFGCVEIVVVVALGLFGLAEPGPGGFNLGPFNPANAISANGLYLGVVFSVFTYSGWEAIAPLAEESRNPRRNVQRALVISVIVIGLMFVVTTWGAMIGLGTETVSGTIQSSRNPIFVLGERVWGGAWVLLLFAILNSGLATSLAGFNASTRIWFAMGRSRSLPPALAVVHPRFRTPINAVYVEGVVMAACVAFAAIFGVDNVVFTWALALTLGLILTYVAINVGVILHYWRAAREEFNIFLHVLSPVVASAVMLWVGYKSVVPLPPAPSRYAPYVMGGWLLIGLVILLYLRLRGNERWLEQAGRAMGEGQAAEPESAQDAAERT